MRVFDTIVTFGPGTLLMYQLFPEEIQMANTVTLTETGQPARQEVIAVLLSLVSFVSTIPVLVVSAKSRPCLTAAYGKLFR